MILLYDEITLLIQQGNKLESFHVENGVTKNASSAYDYVRGMVSLYRKNTGQWEKWQAHIDNTSRQEFLLAESYHYALIRLGI